MKNLTLLSKKGIISLLFVFMVILSIGDAIAQTIKTIGTGTSSQEYPIGAYYGYERSTSLYTSSEIGTTGSITSIGYYVATSSTTSIPIKIYIKTTTATTITSSTWASMISGLDILYTGTVSCSTTGWKTITLTTPFNYTGSNLLVMVEANYGGGGSTSYPKFRYTSSTSKHAYIRTDNTAPTGNLTVNSYRPNIQLTINNSTTLSINAGTDKSICSGNSTTLTTTVSGGTSPYNYLWSTGANTASISVSPASTTTYTVTVSDAASSTANDNVVVNVTASVTPSVSISATPSGTVIPGTSVTYTATPTNGGTPTYQWKKGGTNISGATSSTYTYTPADGDVISCSMTSTASCANPTTATSNSLTMNVGAVSSLPEGAIGQTLRYDGTKWDTTSTLNIYYNKVGIGTSYPNVKTQIMLSPAPTSIKDATYLGLGKDESAIDSYRLIGFGIKRTMIGGSCDFYPSYIGYQEKNIDGFTYGDLVFLTRNTTGNDIPLERMRITSNGNVGIGTTTPKNILDVATGASNNFESYALIRTSASVGYQGGLLFTNAPATNTDFTSLKITSSYNGSLNINTNAKFGFVRNSATEAWLNDGPAIQLAASTGNVYIAQGSGNVLIGKTSQQNTEYKLDVAGKIRANEIVVNTDGADFVFDDTYELMSLTKLEKYIKENKHLPLVPSAIKMQKEGMSVSETNTILLQKIEELTLYIIEQNKKIENLQKKVEVLENK